MSKKNTVVTTTTKTNPTSKKTLMIKAKKNASVPAASPIAKTGTQPAAKAPQADKAERIGVNIGKSSGMRVMAFQDHTLARNDDPKFRLTDTELAKAWREEFPNSRAVLNGRIDEAIVRGVRNLYNQGTGGHGTPGKTMTSKPYSLVDGKRVVVEYTRARKVGEPEAAKPEAKKAAAPVAKGPAVVATPKGKVVVARRRAKAA